MSKKLIDLATEIADSRESELPLKLIKLKELALYNDDAKKMKYDIYKFDLLEALSVAFTYEYGFIKDGWRLALDLVKTFDICTTDFELTDKKYQNVFLPNATENILVLAKKIQEKHVKSKSYSDEYLNTFRELMSEYIKIITNNQFIALKCLKSQRLFNLLLNDEQYTSAIMLNTYNSLININKSLLSQLDEKSLNLLLDEIVYKMATCELADCGIAIFRLLNSMCKLDRNMMKLIVRRYKGIKLLINRWGSLISSSELQKFFEAWEDADKTKFTDQEIHNKIVTIQRHWRGYAVRKRLRQRETATVTIQKQLRAYRERKQDRANKQEVENELKFQLVLAHRRRQRQRHLEMLELISILPADQLAAFEERHRDYAATVIQSAYRSYRVRRLLGGLNTLKVAKKRRLAAITIQTYFRRWQRRIKRRREQPAFYSRPAALDGPRREFLFDKIRQHLDSLPSHPRTFKAAQELHEKAQLAFHDYVIGQRSIRQQQNNIKLLLTTNSNDAELLTNCPKLSQITDDDIETFFTHKSKPVKLAAEQAHKNTLRKHNSAWYRLLNDDSDSDDNLGINEDDDNAEDNIDELNKHIRNLNFEIDSDHYFRELRSKSHHQHSTEPKGISKKERNQLKTTYLRKAMTHMMKTRPQDAQIWKVDPFDDRDAKHAIELLESRARDLPN